MCFTVNVNIVKEELEIRYHATLIDADRYRPSYYYHAFSLPELPVLGAGNRDYLELMKWGLVPSWVKDSEKAGEIRFKTFNARAETIDKKPSFVGSFNSRRCIVPVRGFFEWQHKGDTKIPWYIKRSDEDIMSLGGLYSEWADRSTGEIIKTFTIITTEANSLMAEIHNSKKRMPLVIEKPDEELWLDARVPGERVLRLLNPYPSGILEAFTISNLITRKDADKNRPELVKPVAYKLPGKLI